MRPQFIYISLVCLFISLFSCQKAENGQPIPEELQIDISVQPLSPLELSAKNVTEFDKAGLPVRSFLDIPGLSHAQVWPEKVPTSWQIKLPLLSQTAILGSLTGKINDQSIILLSLETTGTHADIVNNYDKTLRNQGFRPLPPGVFSLPVFQYSNTYCKKELEVLVHIRTNASIGLSQIVLIQRSPTDLRCDEP